LAQWLREHRELQQMRSRERRGAARSATHRLGDDSVVLGLALSLGRLDHGDSLVIGSLEQRVAL
jgi:hypothetical protein